LVALSSLSVICSALLMLSFAISRHLWKTALQNVFWMGLCDLFVGVVYTVAFVTPGPVNSTSGYCYWSMAAVQFFDCGTVLWYSTICASLFHVFRGKGAFYIESIRPRQHLFVWGYATVVTVIPLVTKSFGPMTLASYCWFVESTSLWRLTFYIPLYLTVGGSVILLIYGLIQATSLSRISGVSRVSVGRLLLMVGAFFFMWMWPCLARTEDWVGYSKGQFDDSTTVIPSSTGVVNFIVWILSAPELRQQWSLTVCCCRRRPGLSSASDGVVWTTQFGSTKSVPPFEGEGADGLDESHSTELLRGARDPIGDGDGDGGESEIGGPRGLVNS